MKKILIGIAVVAAAFAAQATVYRAGFHQGRIWLNGEKKIPSFDQDSYASNSKDWTLSALMCNVTGNAGAKGYSEVSGNEWQWQNYYGYVYDGEMWMEAGTTYTFGGNFDDGSAILIDGNVAWSQGNPGGTESGYNKWVAPKTLTPGTTGWHPVKLIVYDWEGGKAITCGALSATMWNTNGVATAEPTSSWSKFADDGSGSLFRAKLDDTYHQVTAVSKTENGYAVTVKSTAPQTVRVRVYAGTSDQGETATGWTTSSAEAELTTGSSAELSFDWSGSTPPTYRVYLAGTDSALNYGSFWEWGDAEMWAMVPTVSASLSAVTDTSATFGVTLGYDKTIEDMSPPAITLKAYYGSSDGGTDSKQWDDAEDFASFTAAGDYSCLLDNLTQGATYYVRFAVKTAETDWIWSDCISFATAGVFLDAVPATLSENDPTEKSFKVCRPVGSESEPVTVYLSYSGATDKVSELPSSVLIPAGATEAVVSFTMIDDDVAGENQSLAVSIVSNAAYMTGSPASATITIFDDETAAGEIVWTGLGGDFKWETASNWEPARVPMAMDTAVFTDTGLAAGETVTISSDAECRILKISRIGAMTLGGEGTLRLGGINRVDVEGTEGNHTIGAKLLVYGAESTTNAWKLAGSGDFYVSGDVAVATAGVVIRKTGAARLRFGKDDMSYGGSWHIAEGDAYVDGSNRMRGELTIGGEEAKAKVTFANNYCYHGNLPVTVLRNGTLDASQGMNNSRISVLNVYDGGYARVGYFYLGAYTLRGGTIEGTAWSDLISNWPEYITTYESATASVVNVSYTINWWNPFTITVADGAAPVDLVAKSFSGDNADGTSNGDFAKKGPGVIKVTGNCSAERSLKINEGTWLADNETSGCSRANVTVAAGATLGGIGSVLGSHYPDAQTVTVNGASGKLGCLMPGSIDNETGDHIYGTLTIGSATVTNHVGMGNYTCAKIGVGPKNSETKLSDVDKLKVYGNLVIGENCTLDLTTNSAELNEIKGGKYTIVEADAITGTFATVLKPKTSWKVEYVSETVGEETVVKSIVLAIPEKGLTISIR